MAKTPVALPVPDPGTRRRIGSLIRRRRLVAGMTQAALGKLLGVSYQQVQKYEYGTGWPSEERLALIAKSLGVTSEYFFSNGQTAPADDVEALERFLQRPEASLLFRAVSRLPDQATLDRLILINLAFCEKHAHAGASGLQDVAWTGKISGQSGEARHAEKVIRELKIGIGRLVAQNIRGRKFTQSFAAKVLRTDQARISKLNRGDVSGISFERLFRFLVMLGWNAKIEIEASKYSAKGEIDLIHRKENAAQESACDASL